MSEKLFRGQRADTKEFVYGGSIIQFLDNGIRTVYIPRVNEKCICKHDESTDDILSFEQTRFYKIISETVGQHTGFTDNKRTGEYPKGQPIFEGDIVKAKYSNGDEFIEQVVFKNGSFLVMLDNDGIKMYASLLPDEPVRKNPFDIYMTECEVIGNIHDNPGLLKEDDDI